jgi:glycosyltransferase involved in cell wall biosynthesis
MNKIKILIIIHSLDVGGAEGQVYELVSQLNKDRYQPLVCCLTGQGFYLEKLTEEGIDVLRLGTRLRHLPWTLHQLFRRIHSEEIQIIHNVMFTAGVIGTLVARLCRVPVVVNSIRSLGFVHYRYRRPIKRWIYRLSDCVISNSHQTKSFLLNYGIVEEDKVRIIYNGVDLRKFGNSDNANKRTLLRTQIGIAHDAYPVIGTIANLTAVKNHKCLLEAAQEVLKELPRAVFLVIGGGELKGELQAKAKALGIGAKVFFWVKERTSLISCPFAMCRYYLHSGKDSQTSSWNPWQQENRLSPVMLAAILSPS